jgi:hypothetical protein
MTLPSAVSLVGVVRRRPQKRGEDVSMKLRAFVRESNRIEGILRVTGYEVEAHERLLQCASIRVADLEEFVTTVAARPLRDREGLDVLVGAHRPPPGGPRIRYDLEAILRGIDNGVLTPYDAHVRYELLHPFLDGNGRSGRALWVWHMYQAGLDPFALPFLHRFYYQALDAARAPSSLVRSEP